MKFVLSWLHCRILYQANLACFNEIRQNVNDLVFMASNFSVIPIDEFTLLSGWVIRARWREIQTKVCKEVQSDEKYS